MPLETALQESGLRPPTDVNLRLPSGMHSRSTTDGPWRPTNEKKQLPAAFGRTPSSQSIRVHSSNCNLKLHCERAAFGRPPGSRHNRRAGWNVTPAGGTEGASQPERTSAIQIPTLTRREEPAKTGRSFRRPWAAQNLQSTRGQIGRAHV